MAVAVVAEAVGFTNMVGGADLGGEREVLARARDKDREEMTFSSQAEVGAGVTTAFFLGRVGRTEAACRARQEGACPRPAVSCEC